MLRMWNVLIYQVITMGIILLQTEKYRCKTGIFTKGLIGIQIWCSNAVLSLLIYKSN